MLTPSKKAFYAIEAVLYIAYNAKAVPVAGSDVAAAQGLPTRYLEPMMQKLVRAGILRGVRGPAGGYVLGRERRRISLAEICDIISDNVGLPTSTTTLGENIFRPTAMGLIQSWQEQLAQVTIAELCERAEATKIASTNDNSTDFTI